MTPQVQRTLAHAVAKAGGAALIQAGIEGLQEGAQQAIQNFIAQGYNPAQLLSEDVLKNMGLGFIVGGIAGGAQAATGRGGAAQPSVQPPATGQGAPAAPAPTPSAMGTQQQIAPTLPRTPLAEMLDAMVVGYRR
jgi:hypothetical protein